ncbi:hypothetical protein [Gloeobacter kilaueensis]|uniref:Phosphodiester glycosidase domain-containing protein n=1 Tax=Gloeobacter kilaueensis (strain ATCC BAA-2537 / CCAP 1431/1 / ULC 316 / JS1) TaxID=1183438 RepID=U5QI23_GLOK1|nr:hypothetical protein [Gloeobacter kilaueensis]AGY58632.1 hypothetical protein GKIL_2386 [Gloeobacter kilaueensis JS1]
MTAARWFVLPALLVLATGASGKSPSLAFSPELDLYPDHPSARSRSVDEIYERTATPGTVLSPEIAAKRRAIIRMYQQAGFDISLDQNSLLALKPKHWSPRTPRPLGGTYPLPYSIDAPFYQKIPAGTPRVELPPGYLTSGHISTIGPAGDGSDGFGIGVVVSGPADPLRTIHLERADQYAKIGSCPDHNPWKASNQTLHIQDAANVKLGGTGAGVPVNRSDRTVVWIDGANHTSVSTWGTIEDCDRPARVEADGRRWEATRAGDWSAMYIQKREQLPSLGDSGGINAANKSDLVTLIRPGEAIDPSRPIAHALSGPTEKAWKAIVYPASNTDNTIDRNNRGLLGYGFLLQLDPRLDLSRLSLSLPARRILEAIQTYGWYMDDTGPRDFNIKGNFSAAEFAPYGGVSAVDAEILRVLRVQKVYVVPPLVKKSPS